MSWNHGFDYTATISKSITSAAATAAAQTVPAQIWGFGKILVTVGTFSTASSIDVKVAQTSTTASHFTYTRLVNSGSTMCTQSFVLPHSVHGVTYDITDIAGMNYFMLSAACSPANGSTVTIYGMR
jgi:hypothetical protein